MRGRFSSALRVDVPMCSCRKRRVCRTTRRTSRSNVVATLAAAIALTASTAHAADGWNSPTADNWPLVPLHAALMPDGRVMTYGSNNLGQATGLFSYDVWDPADGLSGPHLTLQNRTQVDIFCSSLV